MQGSLRWLGAGIRGNSKVWLLVALGLLIWGWFDVRNRAHLNPDMPDSHRTDFSVYTCSAKALRAGDDIYNAPSPRGWYFLYPPAFLLVVLPVADLAYEDQAFVWYLFSLLLLLATAYEGRRIARWDHQETGTMPTGTLQFLCIAAALAILLPTLNCLQRGQVGAFLLYFLVLGLRVFLERSGVVSSFAAGIIVMLPAAVKIPLLLPSALLSMSLCLHAFRTKEPRSALGFVGGAVAGVVLWLFLVPSMYTGWDVNLAYLNSWVRETLVNQKVGIGKGFEHYTMRNQSLTNGIDRFANFVDHVAFQGPEDEPSDFALFADRPMAMKSPVIRAIALAWRSILALALLWVVWKVGQDDDRLGMAAVFGLGCVGSLVLSPIAWGHHFMALLPAGLLVPFWLWSRGYQRGAVGFACALAGLPLLHYCAFPWAPRMGILGIGMSVWLTLTCAAFALHGTRWASLLDFDGARGLGWHGHSLWPIDGKGASS